MGAHNWKDQVKAIQPEAHRHMVAYIAEIAGDETIPAKYRELMILATSTTARFRPSILTHAKHALDQGATPRELFCAVAIGALSGGFVSMIEGMDVLEEIGVTSEG